MADMDGTIAKCVGFQCSLVIFVAVRDISPKLSGTKYLALKGLHVHVDFGNKICLTGNHFTGAALHVIASLKKKSAYLSPPPIPVAFCKPQNK